MSRILFSVACRAALTVVACQLFSLPNHAAAADFTFVHISDAHVTASEAPQSTAANDAARFREISSLSPKPVFVVNTGDVCEVGTTAEYAVHSKIVRENLTLPYYTAPGNHDVRWNPLGKEGFVKGTGQPLYQSWDKNNIHFVLLDSTVLLQHWGHFDQAQLEWLARDLQKVGPTRPVIIGFHHWIGREGHQVDNGDALLKVVAPYNIRLFLIGHGHSDIQWNVNGIPAIMEKGLYQGSYSLIHVTNDTLEITRRTEKDPNPTKPFLIVPLARQTPPNRSVTVEVKDGMGSIQVAKTNLPSETSITYAVGDSKPQPLEKTETGWGGTFPLGDGLPGTVIVTVTMTLPDGRAYQTPVTVLLGERRTISPAWTAKVGGAVQGKIARYLNLVLIPSMGGDLVALDTTTGKEKWRVRTGGSVFSAPLAVDNVVYFGSADHSVYAVRAHDGKLLWKTPTGGAVFAGAAKAGNIVCIASVDTKIYGLDAATGSVVWTAQGAGMYQSQTATDGTHFFVGGWDNYFRCLDARTGSEVWKQKFGKSFYYAPAIGSPTVGGGKAFVTSNDGLLHAVDIATGTLAWETESHSLGYSGPLYHDGIIYNASLTGTGQVFAFDAATGKVLWNTSTGSVIYDSSCAFGGGNVFVGCVDGTFSALRSRDGKTAWQYQLAPGHLLASPVTDEQHVYIGTLSGEVYAFPLAAPVASAALAVRESVLLPPPPPVR